VSQPTPRLRPIRTDDAASVAELTTQLGYPVEAEAQAARIADLLAAPQDHLALVAVDDADRPIGWVHVERLRHLEADATAVLMGVIVDEAHRSDGIGGELLAAAEAWAIGAGCRRMTVRSRIQRERAHRFYLRHGYQVEKTSFVFRKALG
jgi:GNAT superfamily N-acetyltransferase